MLESIFGENMFFVLENGIVRPARDIFDFDEGWHSPERVIGQDFLAEPDGELVTVSTVFLGMNPNVGDDPPILFETMVFGGVFDLYKCRYATLEEARAGHIATLELIQKQPTLSDN